MGAQVKRGRVARLSSPGPLTPALPLPTPKDSSWAAGFAFPVDRRVCKGRHHSQPFFRPPPRWPWGRPRSRGQGWRWRGHGPRAGWSPGRVGGDTQGRRSGLSSHVAPEQPGGIGQGSPSTAFVVPSAKFVFRPVRLWALPWRSCRFCSLRTQPTGASFPSPLWKSGGGFKEPGGEATQAMPPARGHGPPHPDSRPQDRPPPFLEHPEMLGPPPWDIALPIH